MSREIARIGRFVLPLLALGAFTQPAFAHIGLATPGDGLMAGLLHPFSGFDHLLVLGAIGVWVSAASGRLQIATVLGVVLATALGGALGAMFGPAMLITSLLFASLAAIGLLMLFGQNLPVMAGLGLALVAAALHGYPHGTEIWSTLLPGQYGIGFVLGSGAVVGLGMVAGALARRFSPFVLQGIAASFAAAGMVFLIG